MQPHGGFFDFAKLENELKSLEAEMSKPDFWSDPERAKEISKKYEDIKHEIESWQGIEKDAQDLLDIALMDKDAKDVNLRKEIEIQVAILNKKFEALELLVLFSDPYDSHNAIVAIHAGTGGVDAMDWAEMLLRMILRYCEKKGFKTDIINISSGGEAGIKSAEIEVVGRYAYGYLKSENGVHRLVRISPFDAEKMRHTSFALIQVLPEVEEIEFELKEDDLRIDTFRAGGHGGQNVNKTESAVRITHLPTKITATCQSERSQLQNRQRAMKILKAKLHKYFTEKAETEKEKLRGEFTAAAWGNQARSYVLHPYHMVKDHRTGFETSDTNSVLDGGLDGFVEAFLRKK